MNTIVRNSTQEHHEDSTIFSVNGYARSRAERWLAARVNDAMSHPIAEKVLLTPELAELLLTRNEKNRIMKARHVNTMARDIAAGRWVFNGETIIVSKNGLLNDGQHRCAAVVAAGRAIETFMAFGMDRESRKTVDEGHAKQTGDYLQMDGIGNGHNLGATARKIMEIEDYGKLITHAQSKHTKQEILERATIDEQIHHSLRFCSKAGFGKLAALSLLAAAHYLFWQVDESAADEFMKKLIVGDELRQYSPIWTAREKLLNPGGRLTPNEKLKSIIMGWNNWRAGKETVRSVTHTVRKGEPLPEIRA